MTNSFYIVSLPKYLKFQRYNSTKNVQFKMCCSQIVT